MKPKTKLQMEIVNGSRKLAPVSETQKRYAYKHCFVHYFKRDAKGNCFCLDCGHTWRDKEDKKNCKCPHCGMNLKLENSRKRTAVYKEYFCVITTYKQYQVIRFFMVDCRLKKGSPANYFIIEAVQCWMNKEGKTETLSLLRGMSILMSRILLLFLPYQDILFPLFLPETVPQRLRHWVPVSQY